MVIKRPETGAQESDGKHQSSDISGQARMADQESIRKSDNPIVKFERVWAK